MNNTFYVWVKELERDEHSAIVDGKITFCNHFATATDAMNCYTQLLEDSVNKGWSIWETPRDIKIFEDQVIYTPWSYAGSRSVQEATNLMAISTWNPYEE